MLTLHSGSPRDLEAREQLAAALPHAEISEPDDVGAFTIVLEAEDQERALEQVWDAIAASGTDDHIVFLEHPDLPEHWRARSGRPGSQHPRSKCSGEVTSARSFAARAWASTTRRPASSPPR